MFFFIEKIVLGMAFLRILSGCIEITAAILMIKLHTVEKALIINSSLALIGPFILVLTTTLGLVGLAGSISYTKIGFIILGVFLILYGIKS